MANAQEGNHLTFQQGADLRTKKYYIVKLSSGKLALCSAASDKAVGILASVANSASTSEQVDIYGRNAAGIIKVVAGGSNAVGDYLTSNASGQAATTTSAGDEVIGQALEAGAAGKVISILACNFRY